MEKGKAQWNVLKEVLGWICNGKEKMIQLPEDKVNNMVSAMKEMLRCRAGTPFEEF